MMMPPSGRGPTQGQVDGLRLGACPFSRPLFVRSPPVPDDSAMDPHDEPDMQDSPGPDSGPAKSASGVTEVGEPSHLCAIEAAGVAGVNERMIRCAIRAG